MKGDCSKRERKIGRDESLKISCPDRLTNLTAAFVVGRPGDDVQ